MAQAQNKKADETSPLTDLRRETVVNLEAIGTELDKAEGDLAALESLGLDVSRLKERLSWGRKAREVIMERFNNR